MMNYNNQNLHKQHFIYIDLLRTLSSFMVIATHVISHNIYIFQVQSKSWTILALAKIITQFCVPCFFMISGATLLSNIQEASYSKFIKKYYFKNICPFFIWSFIYYFWFSFALNKYNFSIKDFFLRFIRQDISGHFWYMYALLSIYLLIPYMPKLLQALSPKELRNIICALFFIGSVIPFVTQILKLSIGYKLSLFTLSKIGVYLNYMLMGYYIHNDIPLRKLKDKKTVLKIAIFIIISVLGLATYYASDIKTNFSWINIAWAPVFILSVFVYMLIYCSSDLRIENSTQIKIQFVASLSFTAYLSHMLIIRTFQYYVPNTLLRKYLYTGWIPQAITLIETIVAILTSYLVAHFIHKSKNLLLKRGTK